MTFQNIQQFDTFMDLLEPHELLHWKPLARNPRKATIAR